MFKVECEGCKAPYQIDERRVPAGGLKMRCPKCGTSFTVHTPSADGENLAELPAIARPAGTGADLPAVAPARNGQRAGLPGVAAPGGVRPAHPVAAAGQVRAPLPSLPEPDDDAELPAALGGQGSAAARGTPIAPRAPAPPAPPAVATKGGAPSDELSFELDLPASAADLPQARTGARPPPRAAGPPPRPAFGSADARRAPLQPQSPPSSKTPETDADAIDDDDLAFDLPGLVTADLPAASAGLPSRSTPHARTAGAASPATRSQSSPASSEIGTAVPDLGFGEIDLPLLTNDSPALATGLPNLTAVARMSGDVTPALSDLPLERSSIPPPPLVEEWTEADELDDPSMLRGPTVPPQPAPARAVSPRALTSDVVSPRAERRSDAAPAEFGELSLPEGSEETAIGFSDSIPPEAPPSSSNFELPAGEDDMEFGEIPQQKAEAAIASPELLAVPRPAVDRSTKAKDAVSKRSPHRAKIVAAAVSVLVLSGASLEVFSPWGAFGRHALLDLFNRDKLLALQTATINDVRKLLAVDTFRDSSRAIAALDDAIAASPRAVALLPYGAFVGYITELRYGRSATIDAHAKQLIAQASERGPLQFTGLAEAAEAAVESQLPRAKQTAEALAELEPQNIDVASLLAEVQFLARDFDKALETWTRAATLDGGSARTVFGMARALAALGKDADALEQAKKVLSLSPTHVGARLLTAHALWAGAHDQAGTLAALEAVTEPGAVRKAASALELVDALTLTALVHLARSRMTSAEAALTEALSIEPKAASALAGMGEVLYQEGRFTEALARFEAGIQADPEGTAAKIGAAKTKIALERLAEAKDQLKKLRDARPGDAEVIYWVGRSEEALGDRAAAERAYREAILASPDQPQTIDAYIALSQLLASAGHVDAASLELAQAKAKLPSTAAVHRALGDVHLSAGRFDAAKDEFEAALALEPSEIASLFRLGIVARRMGNLDQAESLLGKVAEQDPEYPALALERGLLYEARNQTAQALTYYQRALAKAPDDPDLMFHVGSAEVTAGHATSAEDILRKVISKRPNSAEVNHYLGRALLLKGNNLAESLRYLKRAVDIDKNRAEYHLYVGWAANEMGQPAVADEALNRALELDKSLADAYWQLGVMLRKQGAVFDAVKSLKKALELRPSRFEAYATLAECYEDENKTSEAIGAWRKAIASDGQRGEWHYRLGKLLGRAGEAELREAVTVSEAIEPRPPWLPQAYFELAELERSTGKREAAVAHFRKFLTLGKVDSPYRPDALRGLSSLGAPYDPNDPSTP